MFGISYHMGGRPALIMPWYRNGDARAYLEKINPAADRLQLVGVYTALPERVLSCLRSKDL
jgi:hypothetical protein